MFLAWETPFEKGSGGVGQMKLAGTWDLQVETTYHHYARKAGCWKEGTTRPLTPPSQCARKIRKIYPRERRRGGTGRGGRASPLPGVRGVNRLVARSLFYVMGRRGSAAVRLAGFARARVRA